MQRTRSFLAPVCVFMLSLIFTYMAGRNIPDLGSILGQWMWFYNPQDTGSRLVFVIAVFVFALLIFAVFKHLIDRGISEGKEPILIAATVVVLFIICLSMVPLNKQGLDELPQIIMSPERTSFFTDTKNIDGMHDFFQEYTDRFDGFNIHSKTHGPLAIAMFWSAAEVMSAFPQLQKVFINNYTHLNIEYLRNLLISSGLPGSDAMVATGIFMGLFFPFVACLGAIPLFYLGKHQYERNTAFMACVIFGVLPNVILFTPQLAQWMLFLGSLSSVFFFVGVKRSSVSLVATSSVILSISFLFGFELLFLLIWFLTFLVMTAWWGKYEVAETKAPKPAEVPIRLLIAFAAAGLLIPILIYLWSGFSMLEMFRKAMSVHKTLGLGIERSYSKWVWANVVEYFAYTGIPVFCLLAVKVTREIKQLFTRRYQDLDIFFVSFVASFLILDLSGATKGEVARVWLFMAPYVALFAASQIAGFKNGRKSISTAVFIAVLIATFYYTVTLKSVLLPLPLGMG